MNDIFGPPTRWVVIQLESEIDYLKTCIAKLEKDVDYLSTERTASNIARDRYREALEEIDTENRRDGGTLWDLHQKVCEVMEREGIATKALQHFHNTSGCSQSEISVDKQKEKVVEAAGVEPADHRIK